MPLSAMHVVADVAVEHPGPGIIRAHVGSQHLCRRVGHDVRAPSRRGLKVLRFA